MHSLGVFVSCCLECHLVVVVVVFHHWIKLGVGQSLHHLLGVIVVVEVLNLMGNFGSRRVVVHVCLSVGLSGFHPRNFFCTESLERVEMGMVQAVQGKLHTGGLGIVPFLWCRWVYDQIILVSLFARVSCFVF